MENSKNYYHLTKKELAAINLVFCEPPLRFYNNSVMTRPAVIIMSLSGEIVHVYTLSWLRWCIRNGCTYHNYRVEIRAMY